MTKLYVRDGDAFHEAPARAVLLQAQELINEQFHSRFLDLGNPVLVRFFLRVRLGGLEHEIFSALFLDARRRLIEYVELFRGTVNAAMVYPREVVKEALARNAAGVIFVHNHPSGVAEPSPGDVDITKQLKAALGLVGVEVVDHLVVGESIASFAELGIL
jgi:DNA repair protein RadC